EFRRVLFRSLTSHTHTHTHTHIHTLKRNNKHRQQQQKKPLSNDNTHTRTRAYPRTSVCPALLIQQTDFLHSRRSLHTIKITSQLLFKFFENCSVGR